MKVTIFEIAKLQKHIEAILMGGEKETIFCLDIQDENMKVKKGELNIHASIYDCTKFTTLEETSALHILRVYKKCGARNWTLIKENIETKDTATIKKSFVANKSICLEY